MVLSHWCKLIDGLRSQPLEFYKCIEQTIDRRQVPGLGRIQVLWPEGGLLSAKRIYLRLTRESLLFDICAAPFGTGFFVSCRLVDRRFPWYLLVFVLISGMLMLFTAWLALIGYTNGILAAIGSASILLPLFLVLSVIAFAAWFFLRGVLRSLDEYVTTLRAIGPLYEHITGRMTYYRIDATMMFQAAVHAALMEVIDNHTTMQKLTPLSEFERRPIMSKLLMR